MLCANKVKNILFAKTTVFTFVSYLKVDGKSDAKSRLEKAIRGHFGVNSIFLLFEFRENSVELTKAERKGKTPVHTTQRLVTNNYENRSNVN